MMMNLFSIFDPSLYMFSCSWVIFLVVLLLVPLSVWVSGSFSLLVSLFCSFFLGEVKSGLNYVSKGVFKFLTSIFLCVLLYNFFAIFPFIFSVTSHLVVTFPFSYVFWSCIIFFSLFSSLKNFLIHLIPVGTPLGLISFMVVVELLSNLIRPLALMFRLTANMMAGHLLMSLIGSALISCGWMVVVSGGLFQMMLVFMELGVSLIQAYVFSTLLLLYLSEI